MVDWDVLASTGRDDLRAIFNYRNILTVRNLRRVDSIRNFWYPICECDESTHIKLSISNGMNEETFKTTWDCYQAIARHLLEVTRAHRL